MASAEVERLDAQFGALRLKLYREMCHDESSTTFENDNQKAKGILGWRLVFGGGLLKGGRPSLEAAKEFADRVKASEAKVKPFHLLKQKGESAPYRFLQLGPLAKLYYLEDASKWVAQLNGPSRDPQGGHKLTCLLAEDVEALQRWCDTISPGFSVKGVYKIINMVTMEAYQAEVKSQGDCMTEVFMYHGAIFPALANIIEEGFDLSACGGKIYVSNRSDYSLTYSLQTATRAQTSSVRARITVRERQLQEFHQASKTAIAANVPLVADVPQETRAMLICKVLVPRAIKDSFNNESSRKSLFTYNTGVSAHVYPHMLVHISVPKA